MSQQSLLIKESNNSGEASASASRGDKRRAELMLLAEKVFLERGYANTTMSEISRFSKASKSTLYKFFGNKKGLFAEIIRSRVPDLEEVSRQVAKSELEVSDNLTRWGLQVLDLITTPDSVGLYKILLAELPAHPELGQLYYEQGPFAFQRYLALYFEGAVRRGQLVCADVDEAALLFASMVAGDPFGRALLGIPHSDVEQGSLRSHVEEAVAVFMARYGA